MNIFDVVCFGALNVDRLFKVNRIAQADEESVIKTWTEVCGGSAANTAIGLARLDCKVGFIGKTGLDDSGNLMVQELKVAGVDIGGIIRAKYGESGMVLAFVDDYGQRALYIHSGVNDSIAIEEIKKEFSSETKFIHLTSFVGEKSFETQKELVKLLPSTVKISFDPGILYARKPLEKLESIIKRTYVLLPNFSELKLLTGEKSPAEGAKVLIQKGVKIVVVKLGSEGCYVTNGTENFHVEPFTAPVEDTTGAGDAFCAGFLYGLLKNKTLPECGKIANFVASRSVMKIGARDGLPYLKDLNFIR